MIKKCLYIISIFSMIVLTFMTVEMLSLIYQANWQGFLYLFFFITLLVLELFILIRYSELMQTSFLSHFFMIAVTMYVSIIYYRIYSTGLDSNFLSDVNIKYCKDNYLLVSLSFVFMIVSLWMMMMDYKRENTL